MKAIKHALEQPFVLLVGIAALIHSTWTVGTLFNGIQPDIVDIGSAARWIGWVLPALMFAVALDVGQINTASDIRNGRATTAKLITFATLAIGSYLLQLVYLLHHVPLVEQGPGLSPWSQAAGKVIWEICCWLVPALLPLISLMYTASDASAKVSEVERGLTITSPVQVQADGGYRVACTDCSWTKEYDTERAAQNALNGHQRAHTSLPLLESNGKH